MNTVKHKTVEFNDLDKNIEIIFLMWEQISKLNMFDVLFKEGQCLNVAMV